jgi:type II secretory pathway pseudopilin PulG
MRRERRAGEEGYILLAVMFMLAVFVIAMAVAAPRIREQIQRDREVETMHRGKQYIRAIKLYYKRFNAYPPNVDALVKTNEIRFLRKRYTDPITGKDDWKPILFGQNKAPVAMGFFGQPLMGGSALAGTGPGGNPGSASPTGGSSNGSAFGNGLSNSGSSFGAGSSFGNSGSSFGSNSFGGSSFGAGSTQGGISFLGGSTGNGTTPSTATGTTGSTGTTSGSDSGTGSGLSTSQTYGPGGIIGFSPASTKQSILTYKTKNHYNEWEFVYSPLIDQMRQGSNAGVLGGPAGGQNGNPAGTGFGTTGTGTGTGFSLTPSSPSTPTSPTAPTTPTQPQQ